MYSNETCYLQILIEKALKWLVLALLPKTDDVDISSDTPQSLASFSTYLPAATNGLLESEQLSQTKLIRILSLAIMGLQVVSSVFGLVILLFVNVNQGVGVLFASLPLFIVGLLSYWLAGRGYFRVASRILIGSQLLAQSGVCLSFGTSSTIFALFFISIVLSLLLLSTREALAITAYVIIFTMGLYVFEDILKLYTYPAQVLAQTNFTSTQFATFNIFIWVVAFGIVAVLLLIPFRNQTRALRSQNERLRVALSEIEARQLHTEAASHEVLKLTNELKTNASQQALGSHEQVSGLLEVSQAVTELSATAASIAGYAERVDQAAFLMSESSRQIEDSTELVVEQVRQGSAAVAQTIVVSNEVAGLYQQLLEFIAGLETRSASTRRILDLLSTIAAETHLLSLNAAIEAAGAGQAGERFRVVAQEVKRLGRSFRRRQPGSIRDYHRD